MKEKEEAEAEGEQGCVRHVYIRHMHACAVLREVLRTFVAAAMRSREEEGDAAAHAAHERGGVALVKWASECDGENRVVMVRTEEGGLAPESSAKIIGGIALSLMREGFDNECC